MKSSSSAASGSDDYHWSNIVKGCHEPCLVKPVAEILSLLSVNAVCQFETSNFAYNSLLKYTEYSKQLVERKGIFGSEGFQLFWEEEIQESLAAEGFENFSVGGLLSATKPYFGVPFKEKTGASIYKEGNQIIESLHGYAGFWEYESQNNSDPDDILEKVREQVYIDIQREGGNFDKSPMPLEWTPPYWSCFKLFGPYGTDPTVFNMKQLALLATDAEVQDSLAISRAEIRRAKKEKREPLTREEIKKAKKAGTHRIY